MPGRGCLGNALDAVALLVGAIGGLHRDDIAVAAAAVFLPNHGSPSTS